MNLSRREFLKESLATLGFLALLGGLYAAPAGWKPKKMPKLEVSLDRIDEVDRIDNRGKAANGKNPVNPVNPVRKGPGQRVKIPPADGNPDSRVYAYNIVVVGDDQNGAKCQTPRASFVEPSTSARELRIPMWQGRGVPLPHRRRRLHS